MPESLPSWISQDVVNGLGLTMFSEDVTLGG